MHKLIHAMAARYTILFSAALLLTDAARMVNITNTGFQLTNTGFQPHVVYRNINKAVPTGQHGLLVPKRELLTAAGTRKVRYEQTYLGIPVYGTVLTAEHDRNETLTGYWQGYLAKDIEVTSPNAALRPVDALRVLRHAFWHDIYNQHPIAFSNEQTELYIYVTVDKKAHLAYKTSYVVERSDDYSLVQWLARRFSWKASRLRTPRIPARPFGFVDAHTGELLAMWDGLTRDMETTISAVGGNTCSAGKRIHTPVKITQLTDGVTCMYATTRVQVQNMKGATVAKFTPSTFPCNQAQSETYDLINGGYSASNDALYYADRVYDMFSEYVGVKGPLNSTTKKLRVRVHYGACNRTSDWNGRLVTLGDGQFGECPYTGSDTVAHEFAHGFTENNSHLEYQFMSGGIDEAFSDMAGEALKVFLTGTNDFRVGAETRKDRQFLRDMCTPVLDGVSIDSAKNYTSKMDVHHSSGVYNKAFCCLSNAAGWNTIKAFKVFARANILYWGPQTTFNAGACGVMTAAKDLANDVEDVVRCFDSVQVWCDS